MAGPRSPENQQKVLFELARFCKQLQKFQNLAPAQVVGLVEKPQSVFVDTHFHSPFSPSNPAICLEHFYCGITSDVVFVGGVNFFYSSVTEGQLSHPVHSSSHTGRQTQVGTGGGGMEAIRTEVIRAIKRDKLVSDYHSGLRVPLHLHKSTTCTKRSRSALTFGV